MFNTHWHKKPCRLCLFSSCEIPSHDTLTSLYTAQTSSHPVHVFEAPLLWPLAVTFNSPQMPLLESHLLSSVLLSNPNVTCLSDTELRSSCCWRIHREMKSADESYFADSRWKFTVWILYMPAVMIHQSTFGGLVMEPRAVLYVIRVVWKCILSTFTPLPQQLTKHPLSLAPARSCVCMPLPCFPKWSQGKERLILPSRT